MIYMKLIFKSGLNSMNNNKIKHIHDNIYNSYIITFQTMKPNNIQLSKMAAKDLKSALDIDVYDALLKRFLQQKKKGTIHAKNQDNQSLLMRTPSTVDTTLRRRGSAISKSKRPESRSVKKNTIVHQAVDSTVTKQSIGNPSQVQIQFQSQQQPQSSNLSRKVLTDRAIYYGNVQLPYLHSSDAISSLYQRPKANQKNENPEPLINPPSSISPYLLTNVKNLYLYYTGLDSLRQLGTGWSNLKSLTVMCSYQLKDLSGLSIFPSLQFLFVPHNNIQQISDIMYHSTLRCLDLQDNKLSLIDQIQYIYTITNLQWVDITQNPITQIRQKYRIIAENLSNKLQNQDWNKIHEYELLQCDLDQELNSYGGMQISNWLIKQCNQQIMGEGIRVGEYWRAVAEATEAGRLGNQQSINDVEIINAFDVQYEDRFEESGAERQNELQLRVTPLAQYITTQMNLQPIKKYFLNKICPQAKPQKIQKQKNQANKPTSLLNQSPGEKSQQLKHKKFSATQKLSHPASQQKQPRLNSVSLKKRLGKLSSVSKNSGLVNVGSLNSNINLNFGSTASSILNSNASLHGKDVLGDVSSTFTGSTGIKFITKRKLLSKQSDQISIKF